MTQRWSKIYEDHWALSYDFGPMLPPGIPITSGTAHVYDMFQNDVSAEMLMSTTAGVTGTALTAILAENGGHVGEEYVLVLQAFAANGDRPVADRIPPFYVRSQYQPR